MQRCETGMGESTAVPYNGGARVEL